MKKRNLLVPSLLAFAAFTGTSYAALLKVGVSFLGRNNDQTLAPNDVAGVGTDAQADWNNLGNDRGGEASGAFSNGNTANITSGALFTDNGVADGTRGTSGVTLTLNSNDSWSTDGGVGSTANDRLMKGIVKANGSPNTLTLTLHGLDSTKLYRFIAYGSENGGTADTNFSLTGAAAYATYFVTESAGFDGTFTLGNGPNSGARSAGTDYVQWDNIASLANGDLVMTMTHIAGTDGAGLAGFQVIELPPVSSGDVYWNLGAGAGNWNTTPGNWATGPTGTGAGAAFATSNTAHFTDLGTAGDRTITVDAAGVTVGGIDVNSASNYTIGGGVISGLSAGLTKNGNGSLTLTGANAFTGSTTILHGAVNVTTIGDVATAGNLGQGNLITLGDTTGNNNAALNYGGVTATVNRNLTVAGLGGTMNVSTANQVLTLTNLNGPGALTKAGPGTLAFTGTASTFSGSITVNAGTLSVRTLAAGTGVLSLAGGTTFNNGTQSAINDARVLTLGGSVTIGITDAQGTHNFSGAFSSGANVLTKTGNGRLELAGTTTFAQMPVLSNGTLALTKDSGATIPAGGFTLTAGQRLEVAPGILSASNPITLNNGALRVGHQGLQAYIFAGGTDFPDTVYNDGTLRDIAFTSPANGSAFDVANYFAKVSATAGVTVTSVRTNVVPNLSFGDFGNGAPFASLGDTTHVDAIRSIFTGKIRIDNPGATTFFTSSDDGSAIFIDGTRVVLNNAFQGNTTRQGTITLTAGLHDFLMYFAEGGGGAGLTAEYTPAGGVRQLIPNNILFANDQVSYNTVPVTVTAGSTTSTIEAGAGLATLGGLTLPANTLLTINGSATFTGTTFTGGTAHQVAVTGFNANSYLGPITGVTNLTKTGNGNLVFALQPPAGTTIASNGGLVVAMGSSGANPLAATTLTFAGGGLGLSSLGGDVTFSNAVSSSTNLTIAAGSFGNGNIVNGTIVTFSPPSLVAPAGNALTLRSNDGNFTLKVATSITGTGAIFTEEGNVNLSGGVNNPGGSFTNRNANVTISSLATGALTQIGETPNGTTGTNLSDNLISGTFLRGSLTVSGTSNTTSITNTRGTMNLTGNVTNSGALTGNANGVLNLVNSSHGSVALTNAATLNSSGTLSVTGNLGVTNATANLTGVSSAGTVSVGGSTGILKVSKSLATTSGLTVGSGGNFGNLNLDPGATFTATITGGDVTLDKQGNVHVVSGTADLSAVSVHANPEIISTTNNVLGGVLIPLVNNSRLDPRDVNVANQLFAAGANPSLATISPSISNVKNLTGALDFNGDDAVADFFGVPRGSVQVDRFNLAFVGRYQAAATGTVNLGYFEQDDNVAVWLDSNQDGTFQANELVSQDNCCGRTGDNATPTLTAGQFYNVMYSVEDTGGGGSLGGRFNNATLNLGSQTGFSYRLDNGAGGNFVVDSGTELKVKAFDGVSSVSLANSGTVTLTNKVSQTASNADRISVTGTSSTGTVRLGDNNVFTVGQLVLSSGSTLNLDVAPGSTAGNGRLVVSGSVTGLTGVHTNLNGNSVSIAGGSLIVNAPIDNSGVINLTGGTLGGTSIISAPVNLTSSSATLAPGDPAVNGGIGKLTTGQFTSGGNFAVQLKNSGAGNYDQLSVIGFVDFTTSNLAVSLDAGFSGVVGDKYPIVLNDDTDPVFGGFNQGTFIQVGTAKFDIHLDGNFDSGSVGNDVYLQLTVVPEPGTVAIMLGGFGVLIGLGRARRRR